MTTVVSQVMQNRSDREGDVQAVGIYSGFDDAVLIAKKHILNDKK